MTKNNEQIIEPKNGYYCIEPCIEIKQLKEQLQRKEQECEKANKNAQDTYDLFQAQMESFNILQGEKIKLEYECEELKKENKKLKHSFKELNAYIEKAQEWLKKQKSNDIFIDEMKAILLEELKCLKKK